MLNGVNKFLSTPMKAEPNGTASSAAAFSQYMPRTIDTTVGNEIGHVAMNLGGPALVSGLATRTVPTILSLAGGVAGSEVGNELAGPAGGFLGAFLGGAGGYKMGERIPIRWGTPKTPAVKPAIKTHQTITSEDLQNRKFFPIEEYGKEPVYTREQANEAIKNKQLRYAEDE